ncbi:MAG TPA: 7-carboxy-7-deazaguanine synthase [Casimicrobium sp.]|jgi:7-carboxy-7-deazaguanine synthase|nr:7-carboxy-7-deazaguanine synthase [Casimicrobium sp.]
MTYSVKEIFYTLQGEGANAGRPAVFCRFAGCNLWSGLERDRESAVCRFCDTDFVGTDGTRGGKFSTAEALADVVASEWPLGRHGKPLVVCTGGEPLLQLDLPLIAALHAKGFEIAVETNGSIAAPDGIDWICVSPKAGAPLLQLRGQELKVVVPQPLDMEHLSSLDFEHRFVQPIDGPRRAENTQYAIDWCLQNPQWRLSVQSHKVIGIR